MQIIIAQAEIEEAIRNHILQKISVNKNMEINIDLAATRGAEGFKATIDIVPEGTKAAQEAEQASNATTTEANKTPLGINDAVQAVRRGPGRPPKNPAPVAQTTEQAAPVTQADMTTVVEEAPQAAEQLQEAVAETTGTEPASTPAPAKSLFGGLKRPVNEPTSADQAE